MTLQSDTKSKEKLTRSFKCDMKNFVNYHPITQKVQNSAAMGYFCPKYLKFELKKIRKSYLSWHWTMISNLNKPWPCGFKNGLRNWVNFHYSTQKSEKLCIDGLLLSKGCNASARKLQRDYVSWHWKVYNAKVKGKLTCGFKNAIRNLANFRASRQKFENLHFDWILFPKAYKDLDETIQKSYVSWHWRVSKFWRKTDSWFQNWHEEFGEF